MPMASTAIIWLIFPLIGNANPAWSAVRLSGHLRQIDW
jgi:hypothetical protein